MGIPLRALVERYCFQAFTRTHAFPTPTPIPTPTSKMMMSKKFIATACVAAVMAVSTPGADAWYRPAHHEYKKTNSKKVSGYNKNAGLNYGKMFNADGNFNHVGSSQHGSIK